MSEPSHVYELILGGADSAGITAAIYAARNKMGFLVLTSSIGGQVVASSEIR